MGKSSTDGIAPTADDATLIHATAILTRRIMSSVSSSTKPATAVIAYAMYFHVCCESDDGSPAYLSNASATVEPKAPSAISPDCPYAQNMMPMRTALTRKMVAQAMRPAK